MATLNVIRRWALRDQMSIREIACACPPTKRVSWGSCCCIAGRQARPPRGKASTLMTYLSRIQSQSKGLPASWRVPLSIAKDLAVLDSVNDDTIDSKP